jgi:transcriptional regulator with XRE-family HTH domain
MTGSEMKVIRKRMGLTQAELAFRLGVHPNTLSRFERDAEAIPQLVKLALGRLDRQEGQKTVA